MAQAEGGRAGQGRAGQGRAGQDRAGQKSAKQGRGGPYLSRATGQLIGNSCHNRILHK